MVSMIHKYVNLIEKYDTYYTCVYIYDICDKYDQYGLYI